MAALVISLVQAKEVGAASSRFLQRAGVTTST